MGKSPEQVGISTTRVGRLVKGYDKVSARSKEQLSPILGLPVLHDDNPRQVRAMSPWWIVT